MKNIRIALAGNPNVGKSTVFNALTGMKQHTGNWSGKTVGTAEGKFRRKNREISLVDLPGAYSLVTNSPEEEVTRDFLCFEEFEGAVVVCDACALERGVIFAIQVAQLVPKTMLCINMLDDAKSRGIKTDIKAIAEETGLPVIGISAAKGMGLEELKDAITELPERNVKFKEPRYPKGITEALELVKPVVKRKCGFENTCLALRLIENEHGFVSAFEKRFGKISDDEELSTALEKSAEILEKHGICNELSYKIAACNAFRAEEIALSGVSFEETGGNSRWRKADSVLTGKIFGIPAMLMLFAFIFWLTFSGANYPSEWLSDIFGKIGIWLEKALFSIKTPVLLTEILVDGVWKVMSWVVAVMLPPMAIFFPLFTVLEDIGYLPRLAFNLDKGFSAAGSCGKQALTMWLVYNPLFPHIFCGRCFYEKFRGALYEAFKRGRKERKREHRFPKGAPSGLCREKRFFRF